MNEVKLEVSNVEPMIRELRLADIVVDKYGDAMIVTGASMSGLIFVDLGTGNRLNDSVYTPKTAYDYAVKNEWNVYRNSKVKIKLGNQIAENGVFK